MAPESIFRVTSQKDTCLVGSGGVKEGQRMEKQRGMASCQHLEDCLTCSICISLFVDPFVTPCGHVFCHSCIATHLSQQEGQALCPQCGALITKDRLNPSFALSKVVNIVSQNKHHSQETSPYVSLKHMITQSKEHLNVNEIDLLLAQLHEYKAETEKREKTGNMTLLLHFLNQSKEEKAKRLEALQKEIDCLDSDIHMCQEHGSMRRSTSVKSRMQDGMMQRDAINDVSHGRGNVEIEGDLKEHGLTIVPCSCEDEDKVPKDGPTSLLCSKKRRRIASQFEDLQNVYLQLRTGEMSRGTLDSEMVGEPSTGSASRSSAKEEGGYGLKKFSRILGTLAHSNKLRIITEIPRPALRNVSAIISSIEYDRQGKLFATAGVSKRISIFDYTSILPMSKQGLQIAHCPVVEMVTRSKLSCISWNKFVSNELASTDYEGVMNVWDASTGNLLHEYEAHSKRIWSVDNCCADPALLATGSDDRFVKVWSTKSPSAIAQFDLKSNVCTVKWHPTSAHEIAIGAADHSVYVYDLRKYDACLRTFTGHKKAVSYVRWSSPNELISASTDSTLRLWKVDSPLSSQEERIYRGHINEKNFVGLAVSNDFIACGSENHEVCMYYKPLSKPITRIALPYTGAELREKPFISAVAWHPGRKELLAATSQGSAFVLSLEGDDADAIPPI